MKRKRRRKKTVDAPIKWYQKEWSPKHPYALAILVLSVLISIFFFDVMWGWKTYQSPDSQAPAYTSHYLNNYLRRTGKFPQWNPTLFGGFPNHNSLQHSHPATYIPGLINPIQLELTLIDIFR